MSHAIVEPYIPEWNEAIPSGDTFHNDRVASSSNVKAQFKRILSSNISQIKEAFVRQAPTSHTTKNYVIIADLTGDSYPVASHMEHLEQQLTTATYTRSFDLEVTLLKQQIAAATKAWQEANEALQQAWREAEQEIRNLANLEQNWDDDGGHAPSDTEIQNAVHVLEMVREFTNQIPTISPVGNGEIVLGWTLESEGYLEISLEDGELIYISRTPNGKHHGDEYGYTSEIDSCLKEFIRDYL